ncbi:IS630 family transposase [Bradyrhizobium sp. sBnM-33]|uniref:IS630 family transposase n=1 Tax=Bradyrhizobium sp. sBnM-33 TaxID=2831780 RepID=UPI00289B85CA|nr:IS630 family transposase [Bradyrhizobium sp. sBnM-33]
MQAATATRAKAQLDQAGPICIYGVCETLGVVVRFNNINMEGMYQRGLPPRIHLSARRPLPRRTYNCAHELGHHVFGHGSSIDELREDAKAHPWEDPKEFLADTFAGFILMPIIGLRRAFSVRRWAPETATPAQIFTIPCEFGVGYPHELWTTRLLARHAREHGPAAGHACLANLVQGTVCKILGREEIKPHKVRYYLENRDAEFEQKMAEVLCVYREVEILKKASTKGKKKRGKPVTIVSYDEKPGIQAIATTAPDLPPKPGVHATFARDHEYKRHGTLSLLAGIDLLTGKVHALVKDRHRSREFIELLRLIDAAYPPNTAIKLILDNHSAHISRETRAWLATRPSGRFELTFTPKHGSWLNLIEGFFSKFARSVLRHIRVASKHELKERIMAGIDDVNRHPVIHTWSYKLADAA